MGTAVFSGMIGVTFLGLFLTPVFYVLVMLGHKRKKAAVAAETPAEALATSH
jgi:hypothetical protein